MFRALKTTFAAFLPVNSDRTVNLSLFEQQHCLRKYLLSQNSDSFEAYLAYVVSSFSSAGQNLSFLLRNPEA